MDFNSFCNQLMPYVTVAAIGGLCYWVYKDIKFIRAENEFVKKMRKALEALEALKKAEDAEEAIALSQNNELKK